jgi:hypothetical protein
MEFLKMGNKFHICKHPQKQKTELDTVIFEDDHILLAKSEDDLQYYEENWNYIAEKYFMKMDTEKN